MLATSRFPDPQQSAYEDTLFVLKIEPHPPAADGRPVLLALPAFLKRQLTPAAGWKTGDLVRADAALFMDMPEAFREMQIADDFQDVTLELYGALDAGRIAQLSAAKDEHTAARSAAASTARPFVAAQLTPAESRARAARILLSRKRIEALLAPHGDWAAWHATLAPMRETLRARLQSAPEGYLRKDSVTFTHLEAALDFRLPDDDPQYAAALATLQSLADEFALAGTVLLVAPVPQRDTVAAAAFVDDPPADGVLAPYWLKFQHDLLQRDIEVVDMQPRFIAALRDRPDVYHFASKDGHPGTDGAILAAEAIAEHLSSYEFRAPRREFLTREIPFSQPEVAMLDGGRTNYTGLQVIETDGRIADAADPDAEVFIFGDSMLTAPPGAFQGHICAHLVRLMGFPMSFLKEAGGGTRIALQLARQPDLSFFSQRKVAIFLFSFSYLATDEKAWRPYPFLGRHPEVAVPPPAEPPGYAEATTRLEPLGLESLRPLAARFPQETVRTTPNKVVVGSPTEPCELLLPPCPASTDAPAWIRLDVVSTAPGEWHLATDGVPSSAVSLRTGLNRLLLALPPAPAGASRSLRVPADAPEFSLLRFEARWGTPRPAETAAPLARRLVARYNSAEDFARLRVEPAAETISESGLHLAATQDARTIELDTRPSGTGRFPTHAVVQWNAERTAACAVEMGETSQNLALAAGPSRISFELARSSSVRLRIAAPAPAMTIQWIELWEDAAPAAP